MKKTIKRHKERISKKDIKGAKAVFRMAIMSSRGQVTVPQDIRALLHIQRGSVVGFEPTKRGVIMVPMKVEPQNPYTGEEWQKIEKLAKSKGAIYASPEEAKKHIDNL